MLFSERIVPAVQIGDRQCALTLGYAQSQIGLREDRGS